jgi:hypothetical protein
MGLLLWVTSFLAAGSCVRAHVAATGEDLLGEWNPTNYCTPRYDHAERPKSANSELLETSGPEMVIELKSPSGTRDCFGNAGLL